MSTKTSTDQKRPLTSLLTSVALADAYTDFILSRQAMSCTPATLLFYHYGAGRFVNWIDACGITAPQEIMARHVREYLAMLVGKGAAGNSVHGASRAIRTLLRFWHAEKYMSDIVKFAMPKIEKKRLPVLTAEQLKIVLKSCKPRDRALILFLTDSGLRRAEVCALMWSDVDIASGLVRVVRGKGGKARSAVIGAQTRRALLSYRRTLAQHSDNSPLFASLHGAFFTGSGLRLIFKRLSKRTGIHITPHALRRTFVTLSLRAGMNVLHLQALGGWADLGMVQHYAQLEDIDLLEAHRLGSPIDHLKK